MESETQRIFVFGSNLAGRHGRGAAKVAKLLYGALGGIGEGLTGRSYALPTKDHKIKTLPIDKVSFHIERFLQFAIIRSDLVFDVTAIGCGLAGYTPEQIAPMFAPARDIPNVYLPAEFCRVLGTDRVSFNEHGGRP